MQPPVRVLIADDHEVVLHGLLAIFEMHADMVVVAVATDGKEAIDLYRQQRPDVALLDVRMAVIDGIEALEAIRAFDPEARVMMQTAYDDQEAVYRSVRAGARAYLTKDTLGDEIVDTVRKVLLGQRHLPEAISRRLAEHYEASALTPRELEVLDLAARGERNKDIADGLGISEGTVKGYMKNILVKLGARDRTEAVTIALRRGITRIDG